METYINIDDLGGIPITLDTFINNIYIHIYSIIIILLLLRIIRRYNIYIYMYIQLPFWCPPPSIGSMFLFFGKPSFCQNEQTSDVENPCWLMSAHSYTMQYIYIYTHLDRDIHITYYIFITYWGVSSSINRESLSEPSVVFHGF